MIHGSKTRAELDAAKRMIETGWVHEVVESVYWHMRMQMPMRCWRVFLMPHRTDQWLKENKKKKETTAWKKKRKKGKSST